MGKSIEIEHETVMEAKCKTLTILKSTLEQNIDRISDVLAKLDLF
jgi:hypothetical protein